MEEEVMITVILGANGKYRDFARYAVAKAEIHGYNVIPYDLGGLGFGVPFEVPPETLVANRGQFPPALFKMDIIEKTLRDHDKVLLVDADAFIERPVDEAFEDEFDIGVTFRPNNAGMVEMYRNPESSRSQRMGYINSGAVFAKQTSKAFEFLKAWKKEAYRMNTDQGGLNAVVMPYTKWNLEEEEEPPGYVETPWAKVRVFKSIDYNYTVSSIHNTKPKAFPARPLPGVHPKILHYKNDKLGLEALTKGIK